MRRTSACGVTIVLVSLLAGAGAFAQLPGDLDGDGEVNLPDVAAFVGCLDGPGGIGANPACGLADFDPAAAPDADVDLHDFAGFQSRFGFGQGPPQIIGFSPAPGEWVVDAAGLTEVRIGFSEPVVVPVDPTEAVDVWGLVAGTVSGFTTSYDADTFVLTATLAEALRDDQITVVVDYTIEDVAGHPLDGEILDPKNAALPSGNGINGGQGVFRIRVLQGDANRDGVVDAADETLISDSLNLCDGDPGFDAMADLNADGCVDVADEGIATQALGHELANTDGLPPAIRSVETNLGVGGYFQVYVRFSEQVSAHFSHKRACFLRRPSGEILPSFGVEPNGFSNALGFLFMEPIDSCVGYELNFSNAVPDFSGELLVLPDPMPCP